MRIAGRMREDITTISYEIFKRSGFSIKFKVKTYQTDQNNNDRYYHSEYVYTVGNKRQAMVSLTPRGFIQFSCMYEGVNNNVYITQVFLRKFIRKSSKLVALLEAYESNEIDILSVDSSGTHINNNFPKNLKIIVGNRVMDIAVLYREDKNDVGVNINIDNTVTASLSILDFLDMYYKLSEINFTNMPLLLLSYIGSPELGVHEKDFREPKFLDVNYDELPPQYNAPIKSNNPFSSINGDARTLKPNKKINW